MLVSSVAASLMIARVSFLSKKGALSRGMSHNFSEAVMREERGFPSSQRKVLVKFLDSSKCLGSARLQRY